MNPGTYTKPLFQHITKPDKWYAGIRTGTDKDGQPKYMDASHANKIIERFNNGTLKLTTLEWLLGHFDYELENMIWKRKESK